MQIAVAIVPNPEEIYFKCLNILCDSFVSLAMQIAVAIVPYPEDCNGVRL